MLKSTWTPAWIPIWIPTWILGLAGWALIGWAAEPTVLETAHSTINGNLSVIDANGVRLLVAEANQGVQVHSLLDLQNHKHLITPYTQLVSLATGLHSDPEDALNLGLGGGTLAHFHLAQYSKAHVDSIEIDPAVVQLAKKHFYVVQDRHRIVEGDGFETLARENKKYDVIWMDEFTPKEGPRATMPAEYQRILRDHLKPEGILIVHLGTARSAHTFSRTVSDYQTGFAHGIWIQAPGANTEASAALRAVALSFSKARGKIPPETPDQVIAVSHGAGVSCARFWEIYRKWQKEKLTDLQWSAATQPKACEDLHP